MKNGDDFTLHNLRFSAMCMKNTDDFTLCNLRFSQLYVWRMLMTLHYVIWGSHSCTYEECWWLLHHIIWGCYTWNVRLCGLIQFTSIAGDCCIMKWYRMSCWNLGKLLPYLMILHPEGNVFNNGWTELVTVFFFNT